MPIYKYDLTVSVEAEDSLEAEDTLIDLDSMGPGMVRIESMAPWASNPEDEDE